MDVATTTLYEAASADYTRDITKMSTAEMMTTPGVYTFDEADVYSSRYYNYRWWVNYTVDDVTYQAIAYKQFGNLDGTPTPTELPTWIITVANNSTYESGYTSVYIPGNIKYNYSYSIVGGDKDYDSNIDISFVPHDAEGNAGASIHYYDFSNAYTGIASRNLNLRLLNPDNELRQEYLELRFYGSSNAQTPSGYTHVTFRLYPQTTLGDYVDGIYTGE